jgi:spermidine synthase
MNSPFLVREADGLWFAEASFAGMSTRLRVDELIHHEPSEQDVLIFETRAFGRVLALDGVIQVTSRDEHIYHETMAHAPWLLHGAARHILIIGGGDGGIAREVLRQPGLASLTMVEIDVSVIETCRTHMPEISAGAFDDPRLKLVIGDGAKFVAEAAPGSFDVIIVDSTDPEGPGAVLFTEEFYAACQKALSPDGVMISQNGMPLLQSSDVARAFRHLRSAFGDDSVTACAITVPSYTGGEMLLGLSAGADFDMPDRETLLSRAEALPSTVKFLTGETLFGALALAPDHLALIKGT